MEAGALSATSEAFSWTIYLMIGFVFSMLGGVVFLSARVIKRIDAAHDALDVGE